MKVEVNRGVLYFFSNRFLRRHMALIPIGRSFQLLLHIEMALAINSLVNGLFTGNVRMGFLKRELNLKTHSWRYRLDSLLIGEDRDHYLTLVWSGLIASFIFSL